MDEQMNDELKSWIVDWFVDILQTQPLEPNPIIENTFTYDEVDYNFTANLMIVNTTITLFIINYPENYPVRINPFSVNGSTENVQQMIEFIQNDLASVITFGDSDELSEEEVTEEEITIVIEEEPSEESEAEQPNPNESE